MTDPLTAAQAKRARRALRPQGGGSALAPKPRTSSWPYLYSRNKQAPPAPHCRHGSHPGHKRHGKHQHRTGGKLRAILALAGALCSGAPTVPPAPQPPPGKGRR